MTTCLRFDHGTAGDAAESHASVFADSHAGARRATRRIDLAANEAARAGEPAE